MEHAKVCEEYEEQMKELEEILSAGPAAQNISVEQLAKQVQYLYAVLYAPLSVVFVKAAASPSSGNESRSRVGLYFVRSRQQYT